MKITILHSSSSGNSMMIENEDSSIMIDAGISYKKICESYKKPAVPKALFITHEHSDHISNAGIVGRKTGCAIYLPELCYEEKVSKNPDFFKDCNIIFIHGGDEVVVDSFKIKAFSTKHDSAASVGYIVHDTIDNTKFGLLTDTGMITPLIKSNLIDCDSYFIECDYDSESLEKYAEYDDLLKDRIRSPIGHLSNQQALEYIKECIDLDKAKWLILGHLSKRTNSPELLKTQYQSILPETYWNKIYIGEESLELKV